MQDLPLTQLLKENTTKMLNIRDDDDMFVVTSNYIGNDISSRKYEVI